MANKEKSRGEQLEEDIKQTFLYFALLSSLYSKNIYKTIAEIKNATSFDKYQKISASKVSAKFVNKFKNEYNTRFEKALSELVNKYEKYCGEWIYEKENLFKYRGINVEEQRKSLTKIVDKQLEEMVKDMVKKLDFNNVIVVNSLNRPLTLQKQLENVINKALEIKQNIELDFDKKMAKYIIEVADSGLRVDYGGGVTLGIETIAEKTAYFDLKQNYQELEDILGKKLECDGIEIDVHDNPRPSHEFMQGKQYSKGETVTINGITYLSAQEQGIYDRLYVDYNCKHFETPIILGVSKPRYTIAELEEIKTENSRLININGTAHTRYEWSQIANEINRRIDKYEKRYDGFKTTGDKARVEKYSELVTRNQDKLNEIKQELRTAR